jgi:prepilin-type processing-associated H-X9-DG protein
MGLALHNFNDVYGQLPAALIHSGRFGVAGSPRYTGPEVSYASDPSYLAYNHTGFVALLPYIEQDGLFKTYNYRYISSASCPIAPAIGPDVANNPNVLVGQTYIKIFACPSDADPPPQVDTNPVDPAPPRARSGNYYERQRTRRGNYLFNTGYYTDYDSAWGTKLDQYRGPFGNDGAIAIQRIKDGTSNTIAIGESTQIHTSSSYGPYPLYGTHTSVHGRIMSPYAWNPADFVYPAQYSMINYPLGNCSGQSASNPNPKKCTYAWGFSSVHPGGANFVMCDGSVRFLKESLDYAVFFTLGTPSGGEVTGPLDN